MENKFFYKIFNAGYKHALKNGKKEDNPFPKDRYEHEKLLHNAWNCGFRAYWEKD